MRLLLVLTVVIAVVALLVASWQRGKRVFLITASVTTVAAIFLIYGIVKPGKHDQITLPPEQIRLEITDIADSESGVRFSGRLFNDSELDLAGVTLRTEALSCEQSLQNCKPIETQEQQLLIFIPTGRDYRFSLVARHPDSETPPDKWDVDVVSRLAYPDP